MMSQMYQTLPLIRSVSFFWLQAMISFFPALLLPFTIRLSFNDKDANR